MSKKINHGKYLENERLLSVEAKELYYKLHQSSLNFEEASISITRDTAIIGDNIRQYLDELKEYNIIKDYSTRQVLDAESSVLIFDIV